MATISNLASSSANAIAVGPNGSTNPVLKVKCDVASAAVGLHVVGNAAGADLDLAVISSGTNENITINAKGSGTVTVNDTATGAIALARDTGVTGKITGTSDNAAALAVGANGATNPVLAVDASASSVATGLKVTGAAAASGLAVAVTSSGSNENLTVDAKGSGTVTVNGTATGAISLARNTSVTGTLAVSGNATLSAGLIGSKQALSGAGAINVTTLTTAWTTTAADAGTLADGAEGQIKNIVMVADGGDGTLTPTNFGNGTTITFDDVGDSVQLQFLASNWWVLSNNGCTIA